MQSILRPERFSADFPRPAKNFSIARGSLERLIAEPSRNPTCLLNVSLNLSLSAVSRLPSHAALPYPTNFGSQLEVRLPWAAWAPLSCDQDRWQCWGLSLEP